MTRPQQPSVTIPQQDHINALIHQAVELYQANGFHEAELLCREVLTLQSDHALAHHHLGAALSKQQQLQDGERSFRQALALAPSEPNWWVNFGRNLSQQNRWDDAKTAFLTALSIHATHLDALNALWQVLSIQNRFNEAEHPLINALILQNDDAECLGKLGYIYTLQQRWAEAEHLLQRAASLQPERVEWLDLLGHALSQQSKFLPAMTTYRNLLSINPDDAQAHANLAMVLVEQDDFHFAEMSFNTALSFQPENAEWQYALGRCLFLAGHNQQAEKFLRRALSVQPDNHEWRYTLAHCLLALGQFKEGLACYESRFLIPRFHYPAELFNISWRPQHMPELRMLIRSEVQLGDQIQFMRYLEKLKHYAVHITFEIHPSLMRLCEKFPFVDVFVPFQSILPACDIQIPLISLARLFNTRPKHIPANIPYLFSSTDLKSLWQNRLSTFSGFRIGVVWACGSPNDSNGRPRSMVLSQFSPLAKTDGVSLFSLQKGAGAAQVNEVRFPIIHLGGAITDFADTAAILDNLDLLITVDTSVAHLAGAMGIKTWLLLPFAADWRWLSDPDSTEWYPTMRLFRQQVTGDWSAAIECVRLALLTELSGKHKA